MIPNWLPSALRFGDLETIAITSGVDRAITDDEATAIAFTFTGVLSATGVARLPALVAGRHYVVKNDTTGDYDISLRGPTGSTGATVPPGGTALVVVNRTSVLEVVGTAPRIVDGLSTIALPAAATTYTMSAAESSNRWVRFTGSPTAGCLITPKFFDGASWFFENGTGVSVDIHTSGANVSVAAGATKLLAHRSVMRTVATVT